MATHTQQGTILVDVADHIEQPRFRVTGAVCFLLRGWASLDDRDGTGTGGSVVYDKTLAANR